MGILDDAIREHLELKRQHGAAEEELARQEAEALGPARREPPAAAGLQPDAAVSPPPDPGAAVLAEDGAPPPPSADEMGVAPELIDAPPPGEPTILPPEPLAEPEYVEPLADAAEPDVPLADALPGEPPLPLESDDGLASAEPEPVEEVGPASSSLPAEPEPEPEPQAAAEQPLVQQPTEEFDPLSIEDDEDDHLALPRDPEPPAAVAPEDSFEDETTRVRQVPPPLEDDSLPPEPVLPAESDSDAPPADGEQDVLEETPDFLQDAPEHDRLWFEQKPPRDFDFDD